MMNPAEENELLQQAADVLRSADTLLIGAGAGAGVDSGLPDFRGPEGFWRAYPAFQGRRFAEISNPHWFRADPEMAWGFFGHRLKLYRDTVPHPGFQLLSQLLHRCPQPGFVFTSNVDGHFTKAGFDPLRIVEQHGSIHFLQCFDGCSQKTWAADDIHPDVDLAGVRLRSPLPRCPDCGSVARPNILMFGDDGWNEARWSEQAQRYDNWLNQMRGLRIVAIELGAGTAIPTVRHECERVAETVIRINPEDHQVPRHGIPIAMGALDALQRLHQLVFPEAPAGNSGQA